MEFVLNLDCNSRECMLSSRLRYGQHKPCGTFCGMLDLTEKWTEGFSGIPQTHYALQVRTILVLMVRQLMCKPSLALA